MNSDIFALVRTLARSVLYVELTNLLGIRVFLSGAAHAPDEVQRLLVGRVPYQPVFREPALKVRRGTVAKYGLLDLCFSIDNPGLSSGSLCGLSTLRNLGFLEKPTEGDDREGLDFLRNDLLGEIRESRYYLKVFLKADYDVEESERMRRARKGMPRNFWPREFVVVDACITNARLIWINKHFYV